MKGAERRRRYPLSDCTNSNKPTPSSSSAFNKAVTKCTSRATTTTTTTTTSLPPLKTPPPPPDSVDLDVSEPVSVCYSRGHSSHEKKNKKRAVANPVLSKPNPNVSNIWGKSDGVEGLDLLEAKQLTAPGRKKQHAVSYQQDKSKDAQLQDFIEKQKAYFKEIDEFKLSVEEVESIDELE